MKHGSFLQSPVIWIDIQVRNGYEKVQTVLYFPPKLVLHTLLQINYFTITISVRLYSDKMS